MTDRRLVTRVVLRNYKSIAACDVAPAQLSFLVGPNGSGKSNFLDALRFIADSLRFSIDHALRVEAVPILLRRIAARVAPGFAVQFHRPIRVKRQQVLKAGELERAVELAARQPGTGGCICESAREAHAGRHGPAAASRRVPTDGASAPGPLGRRLLSRAGERRLASACEFACQ